MADDEDRAGLDLAIDAYGLSERQRSILRVVIDTYIRTGQPVGSKHIAGKDGLDFSSSTVRYELARLEALGHLSHPHTSAGRVPTDHGYRYYVDELLESGRSLTTTKGIASALSPSDVRREIDAGLRRVAEALADVTHLLGVVTAPPLGSATIRHVEVIALQPQLVMVVVISSTGDVAKRVVAVASPIDERMADWAGSFFNEQVSGLPLGARMVEARITQPGLNGRERALVDALSPALTDLNADDAQGAIYVGGQAQLVSELQRDRMAHLDALMQALEERYVILTLLRGAVTRHELYLRIGSELAEPELRGLSLVAANYGVAKRNLGTVSVFGPTRMDYGHAIGAVREAAHALSEFVEGVFE